MHEAEFRAVLIGRWRALEPAHKCLFESNQFRFARFIFSFKPEKHLHPDWIEEIGSHVSLPKTLISPK